jgi:hypothetical protein
LANREKKVLVKSPEPSRNSPLIAEGESPDVESARYAVVLLCLRARFIPQSEFLIRQVNGFSWSPKARSGRYSPFPPNFDQLGREANQAIAEAMKSSNPKLRTTAELYTFSLLDELASVPTLEIAKRWRAVILKAHPCSGYSTRNDEPAQLMFLLERALATRGLDAVVAISSLLKTETDAEARYREIYMVQFLDAAVVRLRGSVEGRDAILTVTQAFRKRLRICGKVYKQSEITENSWYRLEDQFLKDTLVCHAGSWATLISVALDQQYGTNLSVPFEKGYRKCGPEMEHFLSRLTEVDPTFPAWEFPSTTTQDDMLHPRFAAKIRRYHEAWLRISLEKQ